MASPITFPIFECRIYHLHGNLIFFHLVDRTHLGLGESIFFLMSVAIYFIILLLQEFEIGFSWLRFHLKDLLFIPLVLTSIRITGALFRLPLPLGKKEVIIAVLYAIVVFEVLLPHSKGTESAIDVLDVLAYALGGLLWSLIFLNRNGIKPRKTESPKISE